MYEIRHNGIPRSYRDLQATAHEAARLGKARAPADVVEIIDMTSGSKIVMHADGRTSWWWYNPAFDLCHCGIVNAVDDDDQFNSRLAQASARSTRWDDCADGECDMLYAIRKRRGQWTVCSNENVLLQFETYDEAVATARGAVAVLAQRPPVYHPPRDQEPSYGASYAKRETADAPALMPCVDRALGLAPGTRS